MAQNPEPHLLGSAAAYQKRETLAKSDSNQNWVVPIEPSIQKQGIVLAFSKPSVRPVLSQEAIP